MSLPSPLNSMRHEIPCFFLGDCSFLLTHMEIYFAKLQQRKTSVFLSDALLK